MNTIPLRPEAQDKVREISEANRRVKEYEERLGLLYEVAQQASSVSEVSKLIEEILTVTQRILLASASSLLVANEENGQFYLQAACGEKAGMLKRVDLDIDSGIIGWVAHKDTPVIINDVHSDNRFNEEVDKATGFVTKSILAAPIVRGRKVIGVIEIINKVDNGIFTERDLTILTRFASTEALILLVSMAATALNNIKLSQTMHDEYKSTIEAIVTAADAKDLYAAGHSRRVKEYALMAANSLCFSPEELKIIELGALMHDIGKVGISDSILHKAGPLTAGEWYIMRKHALRGANIVSEIPILKSAKDIVLHHHEKYDGKGYPEGLKGEEIPIGARLVAVADAFDTMTTDHSYRTALSLKEAMNELIEGSGTQFCPVAVAAFVSEFQKNGSLMAICGAEPAVESDTEQKALEEAEKKAKQESREKAEREAREKAEREAEKKAKQEAREKTEREAEKKAKQEAREKARKEAEEKENGEEDTEEVILSSNSELYEGEVELAIEPYANVEQMRQFKKCLGAVQNLQILRYSWTEEEGDRIVVSAQEPMAMGSTLSKMPVVERVYKKEGNITIVFKMPEKS